jgi:hypothetical protein
MNTEIKYLLCEMITSIEMISTIEELDSMKKYKRISFKEENEEFLIIDRNYLQENDLYKDLWYTLPEMDIFKQEAIMDLQLFMMINPGFSTKDAMKILWSGINVFEQPV